MVEPFDGLPHQNVAGHNIADDFAFSKHIVMIIAKAYVALGFVKRFRTDITDTQILK